jgi:hypothetical protein
MAEDFPIEANAEPNMPLSDLPLPDKMPHLTRAERRPISGDFLGVGTLEQSIGKEKAEEVFARTAIYERARRSAEQKLSRRPIIGHIALVDNFI